MSRSQFRNDENRKRENIGRSSSKPLDDRPSVDEFDFDAHFRRNAEDFEKLEEGFETGEDTPPTKRGSGFPGIRESFKVFDFFKTINPLSLFISLVVGTSFISFAEAVRIHLVAPIVDLIVPENFLDNKLKFVIKEARTLKILNKATNQLEDVTIAPKVIDLGEIINILLKLILTTVLCFFLLKIIYSIMKWDNEVFNST